MSIEICAVGGYDEVGKNMTALKYGNEVVLLDMGLHLPAILSIEDEEELRVVDYNKLKRIGAVPDESSFNEWKEKVVAIVLGHCHLDHIGAVPYMASHFNAPIIGSPFTLQVLRAILNDEKIKLPNKVKPLSPNSSIKISENITIELVHITHSTPQSSLIVVHTPEGAVVYANDFKFDDHPGIGTKPNYKRIKEIGKKGVIALIVESLYADREMKTPSESVARQMLSDVLLTVVNEEKAIFVTTFASHLARIKSIIQLARRLHRKVLIVGRSMGRYIRAGEDLKIVNFSKHARIGTYKSEIAKMLSLVAQNRKKYLVITTGNQAEPNSVLDRLVKKEYKFNFDVGDQVIFSCRTIPAEKNKEARAKMEEKLKSMRVRIFKDVHASGHSSREDLRDFINMLKPKNIIPAHGEDRMKFSLGSLAEEEGYDLGKNVHFLNDGQKVVLQ